MARFMLTPVLVREAAGCKMRRRLGGEPDCFGVIGKSAIQYAAAGVSIATMHETGGISRIRPRDRRVVICDGFLVLADMISLVAAMAVDERHIAPIESARVKGTRASVDCGAAGSSYTDRAVVGALQPPMEQMVVMPMMCAASPISDAPSDPHDNSVA
jgi:hypothetical protein